MDNRKYAKEVLPLLEDILVEKVDKIVVAEEGRIDLLEWCDPISGEVNKCVK